MSETKDRPIGFIFPSPPEEGTTIFIRGQANVMIGFRDHIRSDGEDTHILTWRSDCTGCGHEFEQTTGKSFSSFRRRCKDCMDAGVQVRRKSRFKRK